MIQETYLPFTKDQLCKYFSMNQGNNVKYYTVSADKYNAWLDDPTIETSENYKTLRQIEKDERFWGAQSFISIFEQLNSVKIVEDLITLLTKSFGPTPPAGIFGSWEKALKTAISDKLILRFEENIPSPKIFKEYLQKNLIQRHFIPYVIDHATKSVNPELEFRSNLEGPTNVDILIINPSNGFNIFIEAKLLSDISYQVSYDVLRNQMARNIDAMLWDNRSQFQDKMHVRIQDDCYCIENNSEDKDYRQFLNPEKSIFLLLTPQIFKDYPNSRLYGYKYDDYTSNPLNLMSDLNHRCDISPKKWADISKRLGWITWEDLNSVNPDCCPWVIK